MTRLRKFFRLSSSDQTLFLKAFFLLWFYKLALALRSFRALQIHESPATPHSVPVGRIIWAVRAASRYVPGAACLLEAAATQWLLKRQGIPGQLRIGVARDDHRRLRAHAWVELGGKAVIGGAGSAGYVPLAGFEERRS